MDMVLGLNIENISVTLFADIPQNILDLKKERDAARENKDWERSDELRREIENAGYVLEDRSDSSIIRRTLASLA